MKDLYIFCYHLTYSLSISFNFSMENIQQKCYSNIQIFNKILKQKMSQLAIKPISFEIEQVGKHIKSSKKKYTWKFLLQSTKYQFSCESSLVSGKIKLILNGRIVYSGQIVTGVPFQHPMTLDEHILLVMQQEDTFQLRIDNKSFNHMLTQQKSKKEFKKCQQAVDDIKIDQKFSIEGDKKFKLNISAIGNGMKKNKNIIQSQNWKQMGSCDHDITYFQNQSVVRSQGQLNIDKSAKNIKNTQQVPLPQSAPQQFNTIEHLFATRNLSPQSQAITTLPPLPTPNQQSPINLLSEYNRMQLMFATQCQGSTNTNIQNLGPQGLQGLGIGSNSTEFTTMQALFAAQAQVPDGNSFNTMQQLFGTTNQQNLQGDKQNIGNTSSAFGLLSECQKQRPTAQEFNTMRNMFFTVSPQAANVSLPQLQISPTLNSQILPTQNINMPNSLDFTTMQQLFATNKLPFPTPVYNNTSQLRVMSPSDFNTMQNLFSTINLNQGGMMFKKPLEEKNQNAKPLMSNTQGNQAIQGLCQLKLSQMPNSQDFNSLQNLFKTGNANMYGENIQPN